MLIQYRDYYLLNCKSNDVIRICEVAIEQSLGNYFDIDIELLKRHKEALSPHERMQLETFINTHRQLIKKLQSYIDGESRFRKDNFLELSEEEYMRLSEEEINERRAALSYREEKEWRDYTAKSQRDAFRP